MDSTTKGQAQSSSESAPVDKDQPSDLAKSLAASIPEYLLSLAHEPSVGLHYVAAHAQSRVAPTLAKSSKQMEQRTTTMNNLALDVRDAIAVVKEDMPSAEQNLKDMNEKIEEAIKTLQHN